MKTQNPSLSDIKIQTRFRAFSGEGVKINKALISGSQVRVWDKAAGHYTVCHSLSKRQQSRLVGIAQRFVQMGGDIRLINCA